MIQKNFPKIRKFEKSKLMERERDIYNKIINYLVQYNPEKIGIFGSYSRGEEKSDSDLDLLVSFKNTFGLLKLIKIENELSALLGIKVDLVTEGAIRNKKLKQYIDQDLKIIYE